MLYISYKGEFRLGEEKSKIKPEGTPPLEARSMVSEDDLLLTEAADKIRKGEDVEIPSDSVLLLFIGEGIYDLNKKMDVLISIFQKASKEATVVKESKTPIEEVKSASPLDISQAEDRVKMIVMAFEPLKDSVIVDTEDSAQFVKVKPRGFLGTDVFAKVGAVARNLGGTYTSQGKESHFKIPKIVEKSAEPKQEQKQAVKQEPSTPLTEVENIKMMFPESLASLLTFTEKDKELTIKPRQFLGTENFTKIASIVRAAGGDYISAGKDSHFRITLGGK